MKINNDVPGLMSYDELCVLAKIADSLPKDKSSTIIEVGSFCGRSSCAFLANYDGAFYSIDPFGFNMFDELLNIMVGSKEGCNNRPISDLFDENTQEYSHRITKVVAKSPPPSWAVMGRRYFH